jgi:hypothetical protein
MRYMRAHVDRQAARDHGPLPITVATEGSKPDGLDLQMDRVRLERWRANPVVLLEHFPLTINADMPAVIGRADNIAVDDDRLRADVTFDTGSKLGGEIDRLYRQEFMHAFSVGFDFGRTDGGGVPEWWEPLEVSAVPLPLDGSALVDDDARDQLVTAARAVVGDSDLADQLRHLVGGRSQPSAAREPIAPHSTPTDTDSDWDGDQAVAEAPNDAETLRYMHAWRDPDQAADEKQAYKLPHHPAGTSTPAVIAGVNNALARLSQSDIPEGDQDAVERHLRDHREDAGLDRGMTDVELRDAVARVTSPLVRSEPADWLFQRERKLRAPTLARYRRRQRLHDLTTDANPH